MSQKSLLHLPHEDRNSLGVPAHQSCINTTPVFFRVVETILDRAQSGDCGMFGDQDVSVFGFGGWPQFECSLGDQSILSRLRWFVEFWPYLPLLNPDSHSHTGRNELNLTFQTSNCRALRMILNHRPFKGRRMCPRPHHGGLRTLPVARASAIQAGFLKSIHGLTFLIHAVLDEVCPQTIESIDRPHRFAGL
jgi:hypothetical protein